VLLDQKRTRRIVQVVAIFTSIAFAGVIFVVLGLILFGGAGQSVEEQLLQDARERVEAQPRSPDAWDELASAHAAKGEFDQAIEAAERATELAPRDFSRLQTLISLQLRSGNQDAAVDALLDFTARNPRNAEAFLQLGQQAEQAGRIDLARLAYQRYLRLAPDDPLAPDVRLRLRALREGGGPNP
jgi:tetratricopeptide (TPR) repeat protein